MNPLKRETVRVIRLLVGAARSENRDLVSRKRRNFPRNILATTECRRLALMRCARAVKREGLNGAADSIPLLCAGKCSDVAGAMTRENQNYYEDELRTYRFALREVVQTLMRLRDAAHVPTFREFFQKHDND